MKKTSLSLFVMKFGSTYDNEKSHMEVGVELRNTSIDDIKNFIFPYGLFFGAVEDKFECIFKYPDFHTNKIIFEVQNLDSKHYTETLFEVKKKLETTFETAGLYLKVL